MLLHYKIAKENSVYISHFASKSKIILFSPVKDTSTSTGVGELEITPVSAAIARYLGIDLTPEGKAARNRRGIAVIVHGPPMSGNIYMCYYILPKLYVVTV